MFVFFIGNDVSNFYLDVVVVCDIILLNKCLLIEHVMILECPHRLTLRRHYYVCLNLLLDLLVFVNQLQKFLIFHLQLYLEVVDNLVLGNLLLVIILLHFC